MKRRRLLSWGAVAAGAAAAGCGPKIPANMAGDWTDHEVGGFLADLDASMARIGQADMAGLFGVGRKDAPKPGEVLLLKKSLRSLVLTGAHRELDDKAKNHPGVKDRVAASQHELDDAVIGMAALLDGLNEGDRAELAHRLKSDPDLPKRLAERLDSDMAKLQMPVERRARLRALANHVVWRLENQPIGMLLDEYVTTVDRATSRLGYTDEVRRAIAARAATAQLVAWSDPATIKREDASQVPCGLEGESGSGSGLVTAGGIILGVSGGLALAGGLTLATGSLAGAFILTAAGVLLLVGLVILIVGAALGTGGSGAPPCKEMPQ